MHFPVQNQRLIIAAESERLFWLTTLNVESKYKMRGLNKIYTDW